MLYFFRRLASCPHLSLQYTTIDPFYIYFKYFLNTFLTMIPKITLQYLFIGMHTKRPELFMKLTL